MFFSLVCLFGGFSVGFFGYVLFGCFLTGVFRVFFGWLGFCYCCCCCCFLSQHYIKVYVLKKNVVYLRINDGKAHNKKCGS